MFVTDGSVETLPLHLVGERELSGWLQGQPAATRAWLQAMRFRAARHELVVLPGDGAAPGGAVLGLGSLADLRQLEPWHVAGLPSRLPGGSWRIATVLPAPAATQAALGWAHGAYRFERYKARSEGQGAPATLLPPPLADMTYVRRMSAAVAMARDLINTPAGDLGPAELADEATALATRCGGEARIVRGDALQEGYPAIHAVGRAAACEPRLIDLGWGNPAHPRVTLVGKGVCFDSGGLDIKNPASMLLMKKDMGGAACVLAVARMVMESALPVRLRVLVPAVENAIAGNAYRPGDVLRTRKGLTVEVGNTDAEGRLVLCDALAAADAEDPELLIDMATLTGAARVALGPELPALFGTRQDTVNALLGHGEALADPMWAMPLWEG
ncbi:MAG TPA: leucyl aminopeptidase family protein, partial [Steroidobacteraceae bacterium]|nr:leucyl aminopeptidase family protein [Steroidobacteraceae bacterium]